MRSQPWIFGHRYCMALLLALAFQPAFLAAQGGNAQGEASDADRLTAPVLKTSELAKLNRLLRSWYLFDIKALSMLNRSEAFGKEPGKKVRQKIASHRRNASRRKEAFFDEFEKQSKRVGSLLRHFGDLAIITNNCFAVSRKAHGRNTRLESVFPKRKEAIEKRRFARRLPSTYRTNSAWPLIYSLPDRKNGLWIDAKSYLDQSYPRAKDKKDDPYVLACPDIPVGMDLSEVVDPKSNDVANEARRISYVLGIMGHLLETYRIDTDRIYLVAEGASTPFAARLASLFPDRFAGLILVNPAPAVNVSLVADNLSNIQVLVIHDKEHEPAAKRLDSKLAHCQRENLKRGRLAGSYVKTVKAWTAKVKRKFYAKRVVLTQASNRFKKAYWVQIIKSPPLVDVKQPPRIEASFERRSNRISIKTRHVSRVHILLNDLMVDLDREVLFDINGSIYKRKLFRSRELLWSMDSGLVISRGDPRILFVSSISIDIPKEYKLLGL